MTAILLSTIAVLCVVCWVLLGKLRKERVKRTETETILSSYRINYEEQVQVLKQMRNVAPYSYHVMEFGAFVSIVGLYSNGNAPNTIACVKRFEFGCKDKNNIRRKAEELCALLNAK